MERTGEEATTEEPTRGGAWPIGRLGAERGQEARQQGQRPQGRPSQKPQKTNRRAPQCITPAPGPAQKIIEVIEIIRARFGASVIGLGHQGVRFASVPNAHTA